MMEEKMNRIRRARLCHSRWKRYRDVLLAAAHAAKALKAADAVAAKKVAEAVVQKAGRDCVLWMQFQEAAAHITPAAWFASEMAGYSEAAIADRKVQDYMVRSNWKTECLQPGHEERNKSKGYAGAEKVKPGEKKATDALGVMMRWARKAADEAAAAKVTKEADELGPKNPEEKTAKNSQWQRAGVELWVAVAA